MNARLINQTKARRYHLLEMYQWATNVGFKDNGNNSSLADLLKTQVSWTSPRDSAWHLWWNSEVCFLNGLPRGLLWLVREPHFKTTAPGSSNYNTREPDLYRSHLLCEAGQQWSSIWGLENNRANFKSLLHCLLAVWLQLNYETSVNASSLPPNGNRRLHSDMVIEIIK